MEWVEQYQQRWDQDSGVSGTAEEVGPREWSESAEVEVGPREWSGSAEAEVGPRVWSATALEVGHREWSGTAAV